jgi:hypothetical protein
MPRFGEDIDAVEAGKRGGKASVESRRAAKEALQGDPIAAIRHHLSGNASAFAKALKEASLGEGKYADLSLDKQVDILKVALAYTFGRPPVQKPTPVADNSDPEGEAPLV